MPSQLINNSAIKFICARTFTYAGEEHTIGSDFPQEKANNVETLVRSRYLIPVVDKWEDKPRHWHRHVELRSVAMAKLQGKTNQIKVWGTGDAAATKGDPAPVQEDAEEPEAFDPGDHTIKEVLAHLEEHPEDEDRVTELEKEGKNRPRLLGKLEEE